MDEPLIFTKKGNMPIADLIRTDGWDFDHSGITYWEEYHHEGELVKRSAARYQLPNGQSLGLIQGDVN